MPYLWIFSINEITMRLIRIRVKQLAISNDDHLLLAVKKKLLPSILWCELNHVTPV